MASGVLYVSPLGNDSQSCLTMAMACRTIPAAVTKASSGDTIIIAAGTYTEGIEIDKNLTLIGFGADATIIDKAYISVSGATVQIFDLALTRGGLPSSGGFANNGGNVTLNHTAILSGTGYDGGGIFNYMGTLTLDYVTVAANAVTHYGGGIYNFQGNVSVAHSSIISNTACYVSCPNASSSHTPTNKPEFGGIQLGGGIYNSGALTVTDSIMSGNTTSTGGGGIWNDGTARLTNVTLSGNTACCWSGGGIASGIALTLTNVTMTNNSASSGGTLASSPNTSWLKNTIIANTIAGSNCDGAVASLGHNLSSDNSCALKASGDLTNTNPLLGPLQDNGGPTPTHALLAGSPAINHGDNSGCPPTDQRGITRPQAGICDIGAYEYVFPYSMYLPLVMR